MSSQRVRYAGGRPEGGIVIRDDSNMITNVAKDIMKNLGKNLVQGKFTNMLKVRTPAYVHSDKTYLDCIKYEFCLLEKMLFHCQEQGCLESPFERLKYITAAQIGAIHLGVENVGLRSPLNPILGETMVIKTEMGSTLYMEQTSHHPPISNFHMLGPESLPFEVSGYVEFKVETKGVMSSVLFKAPGIVRIKLPDQTLLEMSTKTIEVTGLLSTEKIFNVVESITIHDVTNGVNAEVIFDCCAEKRASYMGSFFKSAPKNEFGDHENRTDLVEIKLTDDADFEIGKGSGSYLERITFDGREFWSVND